MITIKIVPKEDMEILRKYISKTYIALIDEAVLDDMPEEQAAYMRKNDGRCVFTNYAFYNVPDARVDMVSTSDHIFLKFLFPKNEEE